MNFARQASRQVRTYATSSASATLPPIQLNGLSGKYAGALFTAAAKKDALKAVESDLKALHSAIKADAKVQEFLANPVLTSADRSKGIEELLKKAGSKGASSELTKNLFEVLAENGRLYQTDKTIEDFLEIMSAHRGEVKVTITTAAPLEKDLQKRLEDSLKSSQLASSGKTLVFENKVNESVQGGLVVDFGDKTVDLSVASRVNRLNASLQEAI
ncbi:ATP synthase F0 subcomplex subunit OSCP atp5 [Microbotryomycetes sp. JL201]|nr:ATP synthase F0 subcomplex subunit OSCP atp5 [Microbotryomycetes sp. JL201]